MNAGLSRVAAVLTDIEGTTTSVSFVYDVLFPYAKAHMADFVRAHGEAAEVRAQLEAVAADIGRPLSDDEAVAQLLRWIDEDRKITALKALQGMIWKAGYAQGDFTGHVYADAERRLREWKAAGLRLFVYSSGSVEAQRLIFGHSDFGDMTPLFEGYFDTRIGGKRDAASYGRIAREIGLAPQHILFLSDIEQELDAARCAGMLTRWLKRDGPLDAQSAHVQARDFGAIDPLQMQTPT